MINHQASIKESEAGFMRLPEVLKVLPISKSSWWAGIKAGRYPTPCKLGPRTTAWRRKDILNLISCLEQGSLRKDLIETSYEQ